MLDLSDLGDRWRPPIIPAVATEGQGLAELWTAVESHRQHITERGLLAQRRERRTRDELRQIIVQRLEVRARELCVGTSYDELEAEVLARRLDPWTASDQLLAAVGA
jgi:LAO/AO transport system kinase